jgi:AcrR family transcriptional regulator
MAETAKRARRRGAGPSGPTGGRNRIIDAALDLAAETGWSRLSLAGIADRAGISLADLHAEFATKPAILDAFLQRVDQRVLDAGAVDAQGSARDRLFEVLMRRFDALQAHKAAAVAIARDIPDPGVWLVGGAGFLRSMAWMLEAAGLSSAGIGGFLRVQGAALVCLGATRTWLGDESEDMGATMAALDRGLRRAESLFSVISGGAGRAAPAEDALDA